MTSEVAILNKHGVAVAADSAATIGDKVHLTANKIFRLGATAPIGLVVWGGAEAGGIPWEVLAKLYRRTRADKHFSTLEKCFEDFCSFATDTALTGQGALSDELAKFVISLCSQISREAASPKGRPNLQSLQRAADGLIASVGKLHDVHLSTAITLEQVQRDHGDRIVECAQMALDRTSIPVKLQRSIITLTHLAVGKQFVSRYPSGFAIFGYGDDQIFPAISHAVYDLAPFGAARVYSKNSLAIEADSTKSVRVISFAQDDAAKLFMEGASTDALRLIKRIMRLGFDRHLNDTLVKHVRPLTTPKRFESVRTAMRGEVSQLIDDLFKAASIQIHKDLTRPVLQAMNFLTKEDLAKLAEALVDVTALKRKFSDDLETVGGPIDVAVASKTDGFIWIKRKHYFDRELNLQFERSYDVVPTGGTLP